MRLSFTELAALAFQAGFLGDDALTAAAVALAESGGDPNAKGDLDRGTSYGLWQIHGPSHPEADLSRLFEPVYNAHIAFTTWQTAERMYGKGQGFRPWSTWKNGAYKKFLGATKPPAPSSSSPPSGRGGMATLLLSILVGAIAFGRIRR